MIVIKIIKFIGLILLFSVLNACSPKYDWREFKNVSPNFSVYFPAKPAQHEKQIQLGGIKTTMNMVGAEVNGVNFAIAYVKTNEQNKQEIINLMQTGMIKNINGVLSESKIKDTLFVRGNFQNGNEAHLYARFVINHGWAIQAIVIGEKKQLTPEILEMFFDSLKLQ